MRRIIIGLTLLLAASSLVWADGGTLGLSGELQASYLFTIAAGSGGPTPGGTGTASTVGVGTIVAYGTSSPTTGITQTNSGAAATRSVNLEFPINVEVDMANGSSPNYTLTAQLTSAPAAGMTWKMGGQTLSNAAPATLGSTINYNSGNDYTISIDISRSVVGSANLTNTVNLAYTPN